ncbi:RNA-binding domain-containing protein [Ekhidna sp. MALMAid0563]|uniref:RNA-binding domain-containing protein n=1 Tax=Ekhidna sp. MALMAid0563 TaxID=3143937 RepID=UPI0032DE7DF9
MNQKPSYRTEGIIATCKVSYRDSDENYTITEIRNGKKYLFKPEVWHNIELQEIADFYIEERSKGKYDVSLIDSQFVPKEIRKFKTNGTTIKNGKKYFLLNTSFPVQLKVMALGWQENTPESVLCEVFAYTCNRPILFNKELNPNYKIDQVIEAKVESIEDIQDRKGNEKARIKIKDKGFVFFANGQKWHRKKYWKHDTVKCKVVNYDKMGDPIFIVIDDRHPVLRTNQSYEFTVTGFKKFDKKNISDSSRLSDYLILLEDECGFQYQNILFPGQKDLFKEGDKLKFYVDEIYGSKVKLRHTDYNDAFFVKIDQIVDDDDFIKKYFDPYLNETTDNVHKKKFIYQYNNERSYWVFSYCNHIIPIIFNGLIDAKNYENAAYVNEKLITLEKWLLKSGILKTFSKDERAAVKQKIKRVIDGAKSVSKVLDVIINLSHDEFLDSIKDHSLADLLNLIRLSDLKLIDAVKTFKAIKEKYGVDNASFYLIQLVNFIESKKRVFIQEIDDDHFVLVKNIENRKEFDNYFLWSYVQINILNFLEKTKIRNLILANCIRIYSWNYQDQYVRRNLLENAFYLLQNIDVDTSISLSRNGKEIEIKNLKEHPNVDRKLSDQWNILTEKYNSQEVVTVRVTQKYFKGFKVEYNGLVGFVTVNNICDTELKRQFQRDLNWEINVKISFIADEFYYFAVTQVNPDSPHYLSNNLVLESPPNVGEIISCKINAIEEFGLFVNTKFGAGLIHHSKISPEIQRGSLNEYFNVDEVIPAVVISFNIDKLELSFLSLKETDYSDIYFEFENQKTLIDLNYENLPLEKLADEKEKKLELEKGYILEQYAILKTLTIEKVSYLKFAKQFFANISSSRSYLLNIYIEYFQDLSSLELIIPEYTLIKYENFKSTLKESLKRIDSQSLDNFPEYKQIQLFIEALCLFNNVDKKSFTKLFDYVIQKNEKFPLIGKISKVALANNLLISESIDTEEHTEFSLSNLKKIMRYINDGIFSLRLSSDEQIRQELRKQHQFWRARIRQDEGSKQEFKATFKTPINRHKSLEMIHNLESKLKSKSLSKDSRTSLENKIDHLKKNNKLERALIHSALKTIAAFANTQGGFLLLGVADDLTIHGLEADYKTFSKGDQNRDGFGKFFDSKIREYFDDTFMPKFLNTEFLKFNEGDILIVEVKPSSEPVFLAKDENGNEAQQFFVRNLSSTIELKPKDILSYVQKKRVNIAIE